MSPAFAGFPLPVQETHSWRCGLPICRRLRRLQMSKLQGKAEPFRTKERQSRKKLRRIESEDRVARRLLRDRGIIRCAFLVRASGLVSSVVIAARGLPGDGDLAAAWLSAGL